MNWLNRYNGKNKVLNKNLYSLDAEFQIEWGEALTIQKFNRLNHRIARIAPRNIKKHFTPYDEFVEKMEKIFKDEFSKE